MRIVLTGGGTGGHIYPAVAIGRQAQEESGAELLYIGTTQGLESRIVPKLGIPFEAVEITGFKRKLSLDNVKTVVRFLRGVKKAKRLLREFKPDAVVGTGGYVCGPVVYAAAKLGIPTLIHEQNVIPGLTNQFLARYVDTVAVSFPESEQHFKRAKRTVYAGNPCATNVMRADADKGRASLGLTDVKQIVLVFGGSRGARAINEAMLAMAPQLNQLPGVHFVFVPGESYYDNAMTRMEQLPAYRSGQLHVVPYLHNMPDVLAASSLVVCRAGASTIAEMTALGIPSILIPSPNVTNNHQEANARSIVEAGAGRMLLERELSGDSLFDTVKELLENERLLATTGQAAAQLGMPSAAVTIVSELQRLRQSRKYRR
ncbi:UDP-N-acetylglucosamine-N-acetylmuramylpentapeptide N-acetylglucosamine transferase [Paenibacillus cellulosilyticus]|uniref:UDP-N-acetylglucosamine--N-acetylmuramyl-(pentapeptide) pyrophosphoryl-undecaprenol N-acetylglucosamine transferase n=1 Tax=Paenibacillus cellulosilyticus TaxID=375489 RepID=A0A2V2YPV6_9BACL|nr:undecaprenyldiphospho-muramoylpentapeptide beta-N-acetylglucosaminyltransferase [Paenibacillus cellulosilyticus]PWV95466.1 UDP-N-acetylglucosamine-N-acetylmuramylpentapeptide N-acetylglucosamine transferase [Paenibacillus cellulosilyticus]QKS43159.1 undecaprenyldiphospho-muramoylpentapeptide beta-N-acetylglucosaminyltransferase [Paenibacillus cellulosilyticus]